MGSFSARVQAGEWNKTFAVCMTNMMRYRLNQSPLTEIKSIIHFALPRS